MSYSKVYTDLKDGQFGLDLNKIEKMERDIIKYFNDHGLECFVKLLIFETEDTNKYPFNVN